MGAPEKVDQRSRLERLEEEKIPILLPPIEVGEHIVGYLWEMGPIVPAGMGSGPVSHECIRAWQDNVGIELDAWEVRFIRTLSADYLGEHLKSHDPDRPSPYMDKNIKSRLVARSLQDSLVGLTKL